MNLTKNLYIGVAGHAQTGKDFFFKLLQKKLGEDKVERFALADALKSELNGLFYDKFGIRIFYCSPEEKELVRPMMVEFARAKRKISPRYFIDELEYRMSKKTLTGIVSCITDIRYENEVEWLKSLGGILVYIDKYTTESKTIATLDTYGNVSYKTEYKTYTRPANLEEQNNNEILKQKADFLVDWQHNNPEENNGWMEKFIRFLRDKNKI